MWKFSKIRKCIHCEKTKTFFFAQRGNVSAKDPKRQRISINNVCIECKKKISSLYWYKVAKYKQYKKEIECES